MCPPMARSRGRYGVSCRPRSGLEEPSAEPPLEPGVSPAHIGPCNACHQAAPETPRHERKVLKSSLSLSLSLSRGACRRFPREPARSLLSFHACVQLTDQTYTPAWPPGSRIAITTPVGATCPCPHSGPAPANDEGVGLY